MNKLPKGTAMRNGQMILDTSSPLHPRNGAAKRLTNPAPVFGQRSRIAPSHEFLHGAPLNDEPLQKTWQGKGNVPDGFGMRRRTAGETATGSDVLRAAENLGNPKK